MDPLTSDRQARLKPNRADRHPSLPAAMWTSAAHMAELVAAWPRAVGPSGAAAGGRPLSDEDFDFRGGSARLVAGPGHPMRSGEAQVPSQ